jgi:virginiamycin B lyase
MAQATQRRDPVRIWSAGGIAFGVVAVLFVTLLVVRNNASHAAAGVASAPPSGSGMPASQPVPTQTMRLDQIAQGRVSAWTMWRGLVGPNDVLVGKDGRIWITEQNQATVDSFDPATGSLTRYEAPKVWQNLGAYELTQAQDGSVWFSGYPGGAVGRVLPDGTMNAFPDIVQVNGGIATGTDGSIWVGTSQGGTLLRISSDGGLSTVAVPATNGQPAFVRDVTATDAGVWFTMPPNDAVGWVGPDETLKTINLPKGSNPFSIAAAPDGSVWVTLETAQSVAHISPDGAVDVVPVEAAGTAGMLWSIEVAADGSLWMTQDASTVVHARPDGSTIEQVQLPKPSPTASGLSIAPDGTVWVASNDGNMIVRIRPKGS